MASDAFVLDVEGLQSLEEALKTIGRRTEVNKLLRNTIRPYLPLIKADAPVGPTKYKGTGTGVRGGKQYDPKQSAARTIKVAASSRHGVSIKSFAPHTHMIYKGVAGIRGSSESAKPTSKGENPYLHRGIGRQIPRMRPSLEKAIEHLFDATAKAGLI